MKIDIYSIVLIILITLAVIAMVANIGLYIINSNNPSDVTLFSIMAETVIPIVVLVLAYRILRQNED